MRDFLKALGIFAGRAVLIVAVAIGVGTGVAELLPGSAGEVTEFPDGEFRSGFTGQFSAFVVAREAGETQVRLVGAGRWKEFLAADPGRTFVVSGAGEFDQSGETILYGRWSSSPGQAGRSLMRVVANDGDSTTTTRYYATGNSIHLVSVEFVHGLAAVANALPALLAGLIAGLATYWVTRRWAEPNLPQRRPERQ